MNIYIVTEGQFDALVLRAILKFKKFEFKYEILASSGYSAALSKSKSLLIKGNSKIALILDSDSTNELEVNQRKSFVNTYIGDLPIKNSFKAIWLVPEFEIIFVNNIQFLRKLLPKEPAEEILQIAKVSPKKTLESISRKKREDFLGLLKDPKVCKEFFKETIFMELFDFLDNPVSGG